MKKLIVNKNIVIVLLSLSFLLSFENQNNKKVPNLKYKLKSKLVGRYIYAGSEEAGFIFDPKSDFLIRIDEDNYMYPSKYHIEWLSDSIFTYYDVKTTEYGVARVNICTISKIENNKLEIIEHFSGLCNTSPNSKVEKCPNLKVVLLKEGK